MALSKYHACLSLDLFYSDEVLERFAKHFNLTDVYGVRYAVFFCVRVVQVTGGYAIRMFVVAV